MSNLPATLQDRVRERIEAGVADLITPQEIDRLVQSGVAEFMQNKLRPAIETMVREKFTDLIKAEFAKPEYQPVWNGAGMGGASEMVKTMMTEHSGAILASLVEGMVGMAIMNLRNSVPRGY